MREENKTRQPQQEAEDLTPQTQPEAGAAAPEEPKAPEETTVPEKTNAPEDPNAPEEATAAQESETPGDAKASGSRRKGSKGKKKKSESEMTEEEKKEAEKKKRNKPKNTKQSVKRLLGYIGEHKFKLVLVAFLVIGSTVVSVLSALLIRPIYATVQSVVLRKLTDGEAALAKIGHYLLILSISYCLRRCSRCFIHASCSTCRSKP